MESKRRVRPWASGALAVGTLVLLCSTALRFLPDAGWSLYVDEARFHVAVVEPRRSSVGLEGASLARIRPNPNNPRQLLATGVFSYVSADGGESWERIGDPDDWRSKYQTLVWTDDGQLRRARGEESQISKDLGKTWSTNGVAELSLMPRPPIHQAAVEGLPFVGTVSRMPDGSSWAATHAGAFYRADRDSPWQYRSTGMRHPTLIDSAQSPVNPARVLAVDTAGRVWESEDLAETWKSLPVSDARRIEFLEDGRPVAFAEDLTVTVLGERPMTLTPPKELLPATLGDERSAARLCAARVRGDTILIHASTICGVYANRFPYGSHSVTNRYDAMLVYDGDWRSQAVEENDFDGPVGSNGCRLVERELSLALAGASQASELSTFDAVPRRAGWLPDGRYYVIGESGVQIGAPRSNCAPSSIDRVWTWEDRIFDWDYFYFGTLGPFHSALILEDRVLIPGLDGMYAVSLADGEFPWWRRPLHFLVHNLGRVWGLWLGAAVFILWRLRSRR